MKRPLLLVLILVACISIRSNAQHRLVKKWETDTTLKVPESVLYDERGQLLYVSNIDGKSDEKDGKGSIGKVSLDGKVIKTDWVKGLNAPKGLGLYKMNIYAADLDEVAVIDINKAAIVDRIHVPGAVFLNDITIDPRGIVYVSDTRAGKVFRIENGVPMLWLDKLKAPNGLLSIGNELYMLDSGALYKVEKDKSLTKLADGMDASTDGLENVTGKDFIVSCWAGSIWYVKGDGTKEHLLDTKAEKMNTADIGYDHRTRTLYVPTFFSNKIVAYELE